MNQAPDPEAQTDCPICLETLQQGRLVAHVYATGSHMFHASCLWRHISTDGHGQDTPCPMCRSAIGYTCYEGARMFR